MSDNLRKPLSEKVSESLTPDSQKSGAEKVKENVTDNLDKAANVLTPDSSKSTSQKLADKTQNAFDNAKTDAETAKENAKSDYHKAKADHLQHEKTFGETVSEYVEAGKKELENAANYISEALSGAEADAKAGAEKAQENLAQKKKELDSDLAADKKKLDDDLASAKNKAQANANQAQANANKAQANANAKTA